jgi:hypothetical protein
MSSRRGNEAFSNDVDPDVARLWILQRGRTMGLLGNGGGSLKSNASQGDHGQCTKSSLS